MMKKITTKLSNLDRSVHVKMQMLALDREQNKEKGAGAVEYGLVIAVVVTLVVGIAGVMAEPLEKFFKAAVDNVSAFLGKSSG